MPDWPVLLLLLYCLAIASVSLLGGLLPARVRMTHTRIQLIMSFVSGLMLFASAAVMVQVEVGKEEVVEFLCRKDVFKEGEGKVLA